MDHDEELIALKVENQNLQREVEQLRYKNEVLFKENANYKMLRDRRQEALQGIRLLYESVEID